MLIACPSCATFYNVEPASLGSAGRSVRCASCRNVWFAAPQDMMEMADAMSQAASSALTEAGIAEEMLPGPDAEDAGAAEPPPDETASESIQGPDAGAAGAAADALNMIRPEIVADAPPLAPVDADKDAPSGPVNAAGADIETFAARRAQRIKNRQRQRWTALLPLTILLLIVINAALIGWRTDIVRYMPQTASLYAMIGMPVNLRGLTFTEVRTSTETHEGVPVLSVEGTITSVSSQTVEVPRLRFAIRNNTGHEIYTWTAQPSRHILAPGEILTFRSRLASPPAEARDVQVRFFTRHDLASGVR